METPLSDLTDSATTTKANDPRYNADATKQEIERKSAKKRKVEPTRDNQERREQTEQEKVKLKKVPAGFEYLEVEWTLFKELGACYPSVG